MSGPDVLVTGLPASGKTTLARELAAELRLPLLSLDSVKEALVDGLDAEATADRERVRRVAAAVVARLAAEQPGGCVVDIWLDPARDQGDVLAALRDSGRPWVELVCRVPAEVALGRYDLRHRHPAHRPLDEDLSHRIRAAAAALEPTGLGPHLDVDTAGPLTEDGRRRVRSWLAGHGVGR